MSARALHAWRYSENELQVQIGTEMQSYTRTPSKQLRILVHSDEVDRVPQGIPESYYTAQLLLYGLPPASSLAQAIQCFKPAFATLEPGYKLKPKDSVIAISKVLKAEYNARKQLEEERIEQIQNELEAIAAMKQKEEQLKQELLCLKPVVTPEQGSSTSQSQKQLPLTQEDTGSQAEERSLPQTSLPAEPPKRKKKESKRSREEDSALQEECAQPPCKKDRLAEHSSDRATSTRKDSGFDGMPNASHNDLADRFEGSWKLSDSTGRKFGGQFPARITIEKHLIHKSRKRTELTAYIGSLELEGLSAYIVAKDLGSKSHIIGPCLKTTFAWVTVPDTAGSHQEGSLDIFFDGSKIDGYLSGSSVPRPIAFRGLPGLVRSAATDTRKESNDLWNAYHRALSKVSKNKRKGAKRGSRDQRSKSEY